MILTNRVLQIVVASLFLALPSLFNLASGPNIEPLSTKVIFTSKTPDTDWSIPLKSSAGGTLYVLSLKPESDSYGHVLSLNLVLRHSDGKPDTHNLLEPKGNWHGLQEYMFAADDLAKGTRHSAFGAKRKLILPDLGLVLRAVISNAAVAPFTRGNFAIKRLDLEISVENLNP
jgi:hypothetical protein